MIESSFLYQLLKKRIDFYTGVPDSLLKSFCAYIFDNVAKDRHIIAANEGNAIALAAGHYLATGNIALVYMQNSGLGNAINPLISLTDRKVYHIPLLLMIGWRGEPGQPDAPQHITDGKITLDLLKTAGIYFEILPQAAVEARESLKRIFEVIRKNGCPCALIIRKDTFQPYIQKKRVKAPLADLSREQAIKIIIDHLNPKDAIVSTAGHISRELFEYNQKLKGKQGRNFLNIGAMGHSSQIALSIALEKPRRQIYCLDGDGAVIMHMGSMATIGAKGTPNFKHVILNNGSHDSVGGQPSVAFSIDFVRIARACGYYFAARANSAKQLKKRIMDFAKARGPALLEVIVKKGSRKDLGRPTLSPLEIKASFIKFLRKR
ncbi:MAG: phosphonopyruvate decarboxylase [Candidatus Omnitrophota bacterium]|nr:MAG: phosphonopyruvate decarboxylase [Candidatus Omnitrophota bacterium]